MVHKKADKTLPLTFFCILHSIVPGELNYTKGVHRGEIFDPVANVSRDVYSCRFTLDPGEFFSKLMIHLQNTRTGPKTSLRKN